MLRSTYKPPIFDFLRDFPLLDKPAPKKSQPAAVDEKIEPVEEDLYAYKFTEYLAQKKTIFKKEERAQENIATTKGVEAVKENMEKVTDLSSILRDQEVYNFAVGKTELSNLLTF